MPVGSTTDDEVLSVSRSRDPSDEKDDDDILFAFAPDYRRDSSALDETREVVQRFLVTKDRSTFATGARTKYLEVLVDGSVRVKDPKEARPDGLIKDPLKFFSGKGDDGARVSVRHGGKKRWYKFSTDKEKQAFFSQLEKLKSAKRSKSAMNKSNKYGTELFYFVPDEVEVFFINKAVIMRVGSLNEYNDKLVAITNYRLVVVDTIGPTMQSSIKNGDSIISALTVEHASVNEFTIDGDTVTFSTNDLRTLVLDLSNIATTLLKTQCMNILRNQMQTVMDPRDVFAFSGWYSALRALKMKGPRTPLTSASMTAIDFPSTMTAAPPTASGLTSASAAMGSSSAASTPKHSKASTMKFSTLTRMIGGGGSGASGSDDDEEEAAASDKKKVVVEKIDDADMMSELWTRLRQSRQSREARRQQMIDEYMRLGFVEDDADCKYRISFANEDWSVCESYPPVLLVPAKASDELLRKAATHRSSNRLVAITWANRRHVTMSRCSQPCAGLGSTKKSDEDELVIRLLNEMNEHSASYFICDCRPKKNAMANAILKGKGFEGDSYASSHIMFFDIENIHVMRHSLASLKKCCEDQHSSSWLSALSSSSYLQHLSKILQCANKVANMIDHDRISVLVHCSDGWDRTAQVCALSQVLLDSYYRKFKGFLILIQKEWLWFGHKCADRNGNFGMFGVPRHKPKERSPIFLQFLDCVYQVMIQYPWAFEFTPDLLLELMKHYSSARFGDFLCNFERERAEMDLWIQTPSLFKYLEDRWNGVFDGGAAEDVGSPAMSSSLSTSSAVSGVSVSGAPTGVLANFHNVSYIPTHRVLKPRPYVRDLKLWDELYCRFTTHDKDRRSVASSKANLAAYFAANSLTGVGHKSGSRSVAQSLSVSTSSIGGPPPIMASSLRHAPAASMPSGAPLHKMSLPQRISSIPPPPKKKASLRAAAAGARDDSSSDEHADTPELEDDSPSVSKPHVVEELLLKVKRLEAMLAHCKCQARPGRLDIRISSDAPFVSDSVVPEIVSPSAAEDDYFITSIGSVV